MNLLHRNLPRRTLRDEGTDDAGHQNQQHGAVQHIVVQQAFAAGQDDVVAHQHRRQRCRRLRIAQPVHQVPFDAAHPVNLLRQPAGNPLARQGNGNHHARHLQRVAVAEDDMHVYQHPHAYQEIGNEKRVAHKLQVVHQRRDVRNQAVQH